MSGCVGRGTPLLMASIRFSQQVCTTSDCITRAQAMWSHMILSRGVGGQDAWLTGERSNHVHRITKISMVPISSAPTGSRTTEGITYK